MYTVLHAGLLVFQAALSFLVGYLLLLTGAAMRAARVTAKRAGPPTSRFIILVPAHNEELLLPVTLKSLRVLDYPKALYTVHVVADNCTDRTAEVAKVGGAVVHERTNSTLRGKGYALQWLLQTLWEANAPHDAVVILDADTVVSPNFLRVMDARLARGERVIQAYYAVSDTDASRSASLRYAALAVLHYLRPQGRMVLGGSAGLKGNGMVFAADVVRTYEWSAAVTEDIEFHMTILLAGERVTFAPDAVVWAEMPDTLDDSQTQNVRWEQGRVEMGKKYVPRLFKQAWVQRRQGRSFVLFDAAMEHIIPPFSILAGLSVVGAVLAAVLSGRWFGRSTLQFVNLALGAFTILGQVVYMFAGLRLAKAPKHIYKTLLYAPGFIVWKVILYGKVLFGRNSQGWVRTARNRE